MQPEINFSSKCISNMYKMFKKETPLFGFVVDMIVEIHQIFEKEDTLVRLHGCEFTAVGDIHGELEVVRSLAIYQQLGQGKKFIFLGDYVDRGTQSMRTLFLLFMYKIIRPNEITMLRGNHETFGKCSGENGLLKDLIESYGNLKAQILYEALNDVFNVMPLAGVVNDEIFLSHAGIAVQMLNPPNPYTLEEISQLSKEYPEDETWLEPQVQLVWNDPVENIPFCGYNHLRGSGALYNKEAVMRFLQENDLKYIVKGHQRVEGGSKKYFEGRVISIHSTYEGGKELGNCKMVKLYAGREPIIKEIP